MPDADAVLTALAAWADTLTRDAEAALVAFADTYANLPPEVSALPEEE